MANKSDGSAHTTATVTVNGVNKGRITGVVVVDGRIVPDTTDQGVKQ